MIRISARSLSTTASGGSPDTCNGNHRESGRLGVPRRRIIFPTFGSKAIATALAARGSTESHCWKPKAVDHGMNAVIGKKSATPRARAREDVVTRRKYCNGITIRAVASATTDQSWSITQELLIVPNVGTLGGAMEITPIWITTTRTQIARKLPMTSTSVEVSAARPSTGRLKVNSIQTKLLRNRNPPPSNEPYLSPASDRSRQSRQTEAF